MWTIEINYTTGDSFNTYREIDIVGQIWKNLENAKISLKRIKEHAIYYKALSSFSYRYNQEDLKKPSFITDNQEKYMINIIDDENNEKEINAFWIGYFETIHSGRIIAYGDDEKINDMEFEL